MLGMGGFDTLGDLFQVDGNGTGLIPGSAVSQQCRAGRKEAFPWISVGWLDDGGGAGRAEGGAGAALSSAQAAGQLQLHSFIPLHPEIQDLSEARQKETAGGRS